MKSGGYRVIRGGSTGLYTGLAKVIEEVGGAVVMSGRGWADPLQTKRD